MSVRNPTLRNLALATLVIGALAAAVAGAAQMMRYETTPGTPAHSRPAWPAASTLSPPSTRPVLLLVVHPDCPCSRQSLTELARLLQSAATPVDCRILFAPPEEGPSVDFPSLSLWKQAQSIPNITLIADTHREGEHLFGAATSGQAFLYDATGHLRFSGGITPGRGMEGNNAGEDALKAYLASGRLPDTSSPVFGCALH